MFLSVFRLHIFLGSCWPTSLLSAQSNIGISRHPIIPLPLWNWCQRTQMKREFCCYCIGARWFTHHSEVHAEAGMNTQRSEAGRFCFLLGYWLVSSSRKLLVFKYERTPLLLLSSTVTTFRCSYKGYPKEDGHADYCHPNLAMCGRKRWFL